MRNPIAAMVLLAGALSLAACDSSNGAPPNTVSAFAAQDINTATCTDNPPKEINDLAFAPDETQTEVNGLTPGCV